MVPRLGNVLWLLRKSVLQLMEENHHGHFAETPLLHSISCSHCKSESFLHLVVCHLCLFPTQWKDPVSWLTMIVNLTAHKITTEMNPWAQEGSSARLIEVGRTTWNVSSTIS